jgi:hypothetical protein
LAKIKRKPWRAAKKSDKAAAILKFPTGAASKLNKNEKDKYQYQYSPNRRPFVKFTKIFLSYMAIDKDHHNYP